MLETGNYRRPGANVRYTHGYAKPPIRKGWQVIFGLTAAAGFCWLAWAAYNAGSQASNPEDVPLIQASNEPFRVRPEEPGGMPIPHRDKQIFEAIRGKDDAPHEVKPAPLPEKPQTPEVADVPATRSEDIIRQREQLLLAQQENPVKNVEELVSPPVVSQPEPDAVDPKTVPIMAVEKPAAQPLAVEQAPKPAPVKQVIAQPEVKTKETVVAETKEEKAPVTTMKTVAGPAAVTSVFDEKEVVEKADAAPSAGGRKRAQIAALKSDAEARAMWNRIQGKYPSFTSGKNLYVERADIPGKGVFYRLQVGPFSDSAEVKGFCQSIGQSGCLVK